SSRSNGCGRSWRSGCAGGSLPTSSSRRGCRSWSARSPKERCRRRSRVTISWRLWDFKPLRTILITGLGRFPGAPVNPGGLVATRLVRRRRPAFAGTRRVAHVFATRYDAVDRELPALLKQEKPDVLVMFGVATRARQLRVEQRARNRIALFPDA